MDDDAERLVRERVAHALWGTLYHAEELKHQQVRIRMIDDLMERLKLNPADMLKLGDELRDTIGDDVDDARMVEEYVALTLTQQRWARNYHEENLRASHSDLAAWKSIATRLDLNLDYDTLLQQAKDRLADKVR